MLPYKLYDQDQDLVWKTFLFDEIYSRSFTSIISQDNAILSVEIFKNGGLYYISGIQTVRSKFSSSMETASLVKGNLAPEQPNLAFLSQQTKVYFFTILPLLYSYSPTFDNTGKS